MAGYYIYGDESGKFHKCDYISYCGYIGQDSEWPRLCEEWNQCRFRWGVPPLHMAAVMCPERDEEWLAVKGHWGARWNSLRDEMLAEFAGLICRSNVACVGAVLDSEHYRCMPDSPLKKIIKDPELYAFHAFVMDGIRKTRIQDSDSPISIIVDDDQEYSIQCYRYLNDLKHYYPEVKNRVSALCIGNDRNYPQLQAADMIAYEARRLMRERAEAPNTVPSKLYQDLTRHLIHQPRLITASMLDELAALASCDEQ